MIKSIQEADAFKHTHREQINRLIADAEEVEGVVAADVWINGNCPSFVAGMNSEDEVIVSFEIRP